MLNEVSIVCASWDVTVNGKKKKKMEKVNISALIQFAGCVAERVKNCFLSLLP